VAVAVVLVVVFILDGRGCWWGLCWRRDAVGWMC